jgi:hypothetical protein
MVVFRDYGMAKPLGHLRCSSSPQESKVDAFACKGTNTKKRYWYDMPEDFNTEKAMKIVSVCWNQQGYMPRP